MTIAGTVKATYTFLKGRKGNYVAAFRSPAGIEVLADLAKFCRANETTFTPSQRQSDILQGRREVFLRIQQHTGLTAEELFNLYTGKQYGSMIVTENDDG